MDKLELLKTMCEDERFEKEMEKAADGKGVREVFRKHGIEMTENENGTLEAQAGEDVEISEGELSEEELDDVAGGARIRRVVHRRKLGPFVAEHIYTYRDGILVGFKVRLKTIFNYM